MTALSRSSTGHIPSVFERLFAVHQRNLRFSFRRSGFLMFHKLLEVFNADQFLFLPRYDFHHLTLFMWLLLLLLLLLFLKIGHNV